jgi:carboxyl-terminal processing protease
LSCGDKAKHLTLFHGPKGIKDMHQKLRTVSLVCAGVVAGVLVSVGVSAVAQKQAPEALPINELRQFTEVFGAIKSFYVEPVGDEKLFSAAISGMVSNLDPHSSYLDADAFKELRVGTQGEFGGLGIEVGTEDGFVKVISPIEDTPAQKAGVKAGDLIVKIDDKSTKGMSLSDAVNLMRGKPKTDIKLTLIRKSEEKPVILTIVRDVIRVQSVKAKMLEGGYGYIRITQFQEHTAEHLAKALNKLQTEKALKGLVLDLRNDPGGLLNAAVGVSAAFLPQNTLVVSTDGRTEDSRRKLVASSDDYLRGKEKDFLRDLTPAAKSVPMVVVVNGGSASASEIVAGALQDHQRAKVLGTQTFGKGSVQTILPLNNNTAIKLTTARYYTPSGRSIQATGIEPDFLVTETPTGDVVEHVREADLSRHLNNDKGGKETPSNIDKKGESEAAAAKKPVVFGADDDYQLQQALNYLKGKPVAQNRKALEQAASSRK